MAEWKQWDQVEIRSVYKKIPTIYSEYLIQLWIRDEQHPLGSSHSIPILDSDFQHQIQELCEGKRDQCFFSFGNQDIDFYINKEGKFAIRHSPFEGFNMVFVLSDGELKKMLEEMERDSQPLHVNQLLQAGTRTVERIERLKIYHNQEEDQGQMLQILQANDFVQVDSGGDRQGAFSVWERPVHPS